jgi:uncharacterized protein (TIGR02001 family)
MKKLLFSVFATSLLFSQVAKSEVKVGDGVLTFNAAVNSKYINRGIEQNDKKVTPSIGADFNTPLKTPAGEFGFYLGAWIVQTSLGSNANSTIDTKVSREQDIYIGLTKVFGIATFDIGYINYYYPSATSKDSNNAEGYVKLTIAPEKSAFTLGLQYFKEDTSGVRTSGAKGTTTKIVDKDYKEVNATYDFGVVQSKLSYGELDSDTKTTTLALSKSVFDATLTASFIDAKTDGIASSIKNDSKAVVIGISKTF